MGWGRVRNLLRRPTANATTSAYMRDVLGHKSDAAVGAVGTTGSIMAYMKGLLLAGSGGSTIESVYYVDANVSSSGAGTSWDTAYKTLDEAIAVATTRGDTIYIAPGDYDEGNVVNITTQGLRIICPSHGGGWQNQAMLYSGAASHLMTINAHEVLIDGLAFSQPDNTFDALRVSTTLGSYKVTIRNCRFDGWSGEYGIYAEESPDLVIENCLFRSWDTAAIYVNSTRTKISNNIIILEGATSGIIHAPTGGNRPDTTIENNRIYGVNSGDTGISITGTPTEALFHMSGNRVINCATPVTLSKYTSWYDGNFWGVEDWRYHPNHGKEAAMARGADGNIHYYDLNIAATGLDGRCWASAYNTLAAAITASDADISAHRGWARRNTIYASADPMGETITDLPNRCDIVGVGTDTAPMPRWTVALTVAAATTGCRFYNWRFAQNAAVASVSFVTGTSGIEFHNCQFYGGTTATYGIQFVVVCGNIKIHNCDFIGDSSTNKFQTAAIAFTGTGSLYDIDIRDCWIEGAEGLAIASTVNGLGGLRMRNCDVFADAIVINDDSNALHMMNCRFKSDGPCGGAAAPSAMDASVNRASGCTLATTDSNGPWPNLTAHA